MRVLHARAFHNIHIQLQIVTMATFQLNASAEVLTQIVTKLSNDSLSVYQELVFTQRFVNGVDDYLRYKNATIHDELLGPAWTKFIDVCSLSASIDSY